MQSIKKNPVENARRCIGKYDRGSIIFAIVCMFVCFCCTSRFLADIKLLREVNVELLSLNTEFGISLSAFALSALAIIYALPSGETLTRFRRLTGYYLIILSFKHAIIWCLLNFIGGYCCRLLMVFLDTVIFHRIIMSVSLGLTVLGGLWVYWSVRNIFLVIQEFK